MDGTKRRDFLKATAIPGVLLADEAPTDAGGVILMQVVNLENFEVKTRISIDDFAPGFAPGKPIASVTQISGDLELENTLEEPEKITPRKSTWNYKMKDGLMTYTFPPYLFTILRFE